MKLNINLGVPTADLLKSPTACFRLSKALTRVSDALSFGEHYLKAAKQGVPLEKRDFEHISASIHTSGRSAEDLANLIDDPGLRLMVAQYSAEAKRFNAAIRKALPAKTKAQKVLKEVFTKGPVKPLTSAQIAKKTENLRAKIVEIDKQVESLCTIDKPTPPTAPAPAPAMKGRYGMGAGAPHAPKKRPMYPRYFVASMGRSRR